MTKSFHESSIGCEACHGPGEMHVSSQAAEDIFNPGKLSKERRDMICEACHTDGTDKKAGGRFPFPAFYRPGDDLTLFFSDFFAPRPGSKKWYRETMDYRERHRNVSAWARAGGGQRYSIHDHKFDFSGPELPCSECHGTDDVTGKKKGKQDFNFGRVKLRETLTMEQACARCHSGKPVSPVLKTRKTGG